MDIETDREKLVQILQRAYSGELAAALAYRGHWRSVQDPAERAAIQKIEIDEWRHRARLGEMLAELSSAPLRRREILSHAIGHTVSAACRFSGWFMPMYVAAALETDNVDEYYKAATYAENLGLAHFASELRAMAQTEHDHEVFFKGRIARRKPARSG
ncbi:MAG TPA: ferritin-like domain-containing protein [Blastocatellia bacterium]|nr:ferritin-like domain-containing protein [Blastocatellia bacterium]